MDSKVSPAHHLDSARALAAPPPALWAEAEQSSGVFPLGTVIDDRYVLEGELGTSPGGTLLAAFDRVKERRVAVKVLGAAANADLRPAFISAARSALALSHPGLAQVYEVVDSPLATYCVIELVEGPTLREALAQSKLDTWEIRKIARSVVAGLAAAHARGIAGFCPDLDHIRLRRGNSARPGAALLGFGAVAASIGPGIANRVSAPSYGSTASAFEPTAFREDVQAVAMVICELLGERAVNAEKTCGGGRRRELARALRRRRPVLASKVIDALDAALLDVSSDAFPSAARLAEQLDVPWLSDGQDSTIPPPAPRSSPAPARTRSDVSESFLRIPRIPRAPSTPDLRGEYGALDAATNRRRARRRHPSLGGALVAAFAGLGGGLFLGWLLGLF